MRKKSVRNEQHRRRMAEKKARRVKDALRVFASRMREETEKKIPFVREQEVARRLEQKKQAQFKADALAMQKEIERCGATTST